ncbi:MAG: ATP-binding protein [Myxococcales bacterium]|nr:ATP-binding protein [Myxococcales bacterium]
MSPPDVAEDERDALRSLCAALGQRYLRRHWVRAVAQPGHLGDLYVGLDELRAELTDAAGEPPIALPSLADVEAGLQAARTRCREAYRSEGVGWLAGTFGLDDVALELLQVLATIQTSTGLLRAATFLWADFARKQPTVGFVLDLVADDAAHRRHLERALAPDWPLRRFRLVEVGQDRRWSPRAPLAERPVLVPDAVCRFLRGGPPIDEAAPAGALGVEVEGPPLDALVLPAGDRLTHLVGALARGESRIPCLLVGPPGSGRRTVTRAHALAAGRVLFRLDLGALPVAAEPFEHAMAAVMRDARLANAVLLVRADALDDPRDARLAIWARLQRMMAPTTVVAATTNGAPGVLATLPELRAASMDVGDSPTRQALYARLLVQHAFEMSAPQVTRLADSYRLQPGDLDRALRDVRTGATASAGLDRRAFDAAVRRTVRTRLADLATPMTTAQRWQDLVVKPEQRETIDEILSHARHRTQVFEDWGFAGKLGPRGRGLACLFSGPPGTGKTMTAALIAKTLELDLYLVDLSRVVDKYVGETEKNLARLFDEASRVPVVLLFDEADSLFATRTDVKSANDRYANLEVNFLLQRMEQFEGVSILTTNRETAIDPAFKRRLRFRLHFDAPDVDERARLWQAMVPTGCHIVPDIDWDALARRFEMNGALIRNSMVRAAFLAAAERVPIDEALIMRAARAELIENGRLGS